MILAGMRFRYFLGMMMAILLASFALADVTLQIGSVQGDPGASVSLPVSMNNPSDRVAGLTMRMVYNPSILTAVDVEPSARTQFFLEPGNQWVVTYPQPGVIRVFAVSWRGQYVETGSGQIATIQFEIASGAPDGYTPVSFENIDETDNNVSDPDGVLIIPNLIDGSVVVGSSSNNPPVIAPISNQYAYENIELQFTVSAADADNDLITLNATGLPSGATFPEVQGSGSVQGTFRYTPESGHGPDTITVIFRASDDYHSPVTRNVNIYVEVSGGNRPPVIYPIGTQTVNEGSLLEFNVTSYDLDGDFVTLEARDVPPHGSFSTTVGDSVVSSTFSFEPDFNQGPDTVSVRFMASDDHNNVTERTVDIIIFDTPNDLLIVREHQGALPGSVARELKIDLSNSRPIYGLQFDLIYNSNVLDIQDVYPDSVRTENLWFLGEPIDDNRFRIMILSLSLDSDSIASGSGDIVTFDLDVAEAAIVGPSMVTFDSAYTVQDAFGTQKSVLFSPGSFTIDVLGDANLDGFISIGDCVLILAEMLGRVEPDLRMSDASDYNRDGDVRIGDLQGVVYLIMHMVPGAPPPAAIAGTVEIDRDYIAPGYRGELPLELNLDTEAAGVQFTIDYDPSQVKINGVHPGQMVDDLNLDYTDNGSQIKGAIYSFALTEFGPSSGDLVNLDVDFIGDDIDPLTAVRLTDFEIVTVDAFRLNVDVIGELPESYELNQNYPNPFNAQTIISFKLPAASNANVSIYNVLGQKVKVLQDGYLDAGTHQLIWDGTGSAGEKVTSGIYFYRLQAEKFDKTKKMLLVK